MFYVNEQDANHTGRVFTVSIEAGPGRVAMEDYRDATEYMYLNAKAKKQIAAWAKATDSTVSAASVSVARS